jgi:hypothetical protein
MERRSGSAVRVDALAVLKERPQAGQELFPEFDDTTDRAVKTRERVSRRIVKER